jgi:ankyrin repeat protein
MGDTLLSLAAEHSHKAIVWLLLARVDIDINLKNSIGCSTLLSLAAQHGHEAIVAQLLARDDIDIDLQRQYLHSFTGYPCLYYHCCHSHNFVKPQIFSTFCQILM